MEMVLDILRLAKRGARAVGKTGKIPDKFGAGLQHLLCTAQQVLLKMGAGTKSCKCFSSLGLYLHVSGEMLA